MKLAIITALHERYRLTRLFLDYYANLDVPGVELGLFCAVTQGDGRMKEFITDYPKWVASEAENMPLARKFAANMPYAREWGAGAVMILGSDDFVNKHYIHEATYWVTKSADYLGNRCVYYLDLGTDQMIMMGDMAGRPIGAGRVLSAGLLDQMNWHPWLDDETTGLDRSMHEHLRYHGCDVYLIDLPGLLDCKEKTPQGESQNQTPFEAVRKWPHLQVDAHRYLEEHFPTLKQTLLSW